VFASDLEHFDIIDLETAMLGIARKPRAEGETAFPEIQAIVEAAQKASRDRRIAGERERRMADEARERLRRQTHPEEFETIGPDDLAKMAKKLPNFDYDRPKITYKPTVEDMDCPHCGKTLPISSGVKHLTSRELHDLADVMEQIENQSAANREANRIHQQKCIQDQLANLPATPVPSIDENSVERMADKNRVA
jgi:hypothetical protein